MHSAYYSVVSRPLLLLENAYSPPASNLTRTFATTNSIDSFLVDRAVTQPVATLIIPSFDNTNFAELNSEFVHH